MRETGQEKKELSLQIPAVLLAGPHNRKSIDSSLIMHVEKNKSELCIMPEGAFDAATLTNCIEALLCVPQTKSTLRVDLSRVIRFDNEPLGGLAETLQKYSKNFTNIKIIGMAGSLSGMLAMPRQ